MATEKDYYNLWWEYLKRSDAYKNLCDKRFEILKFCQSQSEINLEDCYKIDDTSVELSGVEYSIEEFIRLVRVFSNFGDVFNTDFENWWEKIKTPVSRKPVKDLCTIEELTNMLLPYYGLFKSNYDIADAVKSICGNLYLFEQRYLYLKVDVMGKATSREIASEIAGMKAKRKKDKVFKILSKIYHEEDVRPTAPIYYDELRRYLNVYDLYSEGGLKKVIETIHPECNLSNYEYDEDENLSRDSIERELRRDLEKARKIITNVEQGYFPGEYS